MKSLLLSAMILGLACRNQQHGNATDTLQRAGQKVDDSSESAKESAKKTSANVGEATKRAGDKLESKSDE